MLLVWRGKGWLVAIAMIIGFSFTVPIGLSVAGLLGGEIRAALSIALLANAGLTYFVVRAIEGMDEEKRLADPATGEITVLRPKHSFYFIPACFWPYIMAATALLPFVLL